MTKQFPRLFLWHVARHARRHKRLAALNVLSVALGVAVYLAIQIANGSANASFSASVDLVAGKANLEVREPGRGLDETLLPRLAGAPGVSAATPLLEGYLTLPDLGPGEYLQVLGVDIFTNAPFATFSLRGGNGGDAVAAAAQLKAEAEAAAANFDLDAWLGGPDALAITDEFARQHGLKIGDRLRVQVNGRDTALTVRSILRINDTAAGRGNSRVAAMDLGWAQELFGRQGRLSAVQLLLDRPADAEKVAAALQKTLPADVTVAAPGQRTNQVQRMLGSFQLNLGALSMISLLVGMFLIYNTIAASVVRRRVETGILRALGATRWEVQCLFLGEALLFGIIGVAAGLVGGVLLAKYLLGREIARVISSLYTLVNVDQLHLSPWIVGSALFFGLGSVLLAAWLPAREGAMVDPVAALSPGLGITMERGRRAAPRWLVWGLVALALAGICSLLALQTGPAWLGFGAAFFVLLGFAFLSPLVTRAGAALVRSLAQRRGGAKEEEEEEGRTNGELAEVYGHARESEGGGAASGRLRLGTRFLLGLSALNLARSVHRTAVIIAALMAAIAMTVGISVMIHAFRQTVEVWINRAIVADIFLTPSANATLGNGAFVPAEALAAMRTLPGVAALDTVREIGVTIRGDRVSLAVVEGTNRNRLAFVGGGGAERDRARQEAFYDAGSVLVSEPFAHRYRVREGDELPIPTPEGVVSFRIRGVYYDYSRDSGVILMNRANFERHWHDSRVMSVALYLQDGASLEGVTEELRKRFNTRGEYLIYSNRSLRDRVFEIFGQTFRITGVLRSIAVVIAVIGIFLTLTTLVTEREREIGVLRALGASRAQIGGLVLGESALIGGLASALGVAAGLVLSLVLTWVINKAFFGWTIQLSIPWATVAATPVWIILAALLAGLLPARRAARVPIAAAVRSE